MTDATPDPGTETGAETPTEADPDFDTEIDVDPEAREAEETVAEEVPAGPGVVRWQRVVALAVLPALAVTAGAAAAFLGWKDSAQRSAAAARVESVSAAREATVAILSYRADTVEQDLTVARDRITGEFLDSYTDLVKSTVIPAAKKDKISAEARVPSAASVWADGAQAVVLVFVDQTVTMGGGAPTTTTSSVRVSLDKVGDRWLVSGFDPV